MPDYTPEMLSQLAKNIKTWAQQLGFQQCGITDLNLANEKNHYLQWLEQNFHGDMNYLEKHLDKRFNPEELLPETQRVICVRMDYFPAQTQALDTLCQSQKAYISRYTLGRDYHKLIRKRLSELGKKIEQATGNQVFRGFVDSAPILERPLAEKAGLGWRGKHTLLLNRQAGSMFFLGELFIGLPLPIDTATPQSHCGSCRACLDICPTQAFPEPNVLDARRCISYLTIELQGSIPEELRPLMGNRIFGCDDCQLICPWNRFTQYTQEADFSPRQNLDKSNLLELFAWSEQEFLSKTQGSAIRRTGYIGWLRNLAVALGNSSGGEAVTRALENRLQHPSDIVQEHVHWALKQLKQSSPQYQNAITRNGRRHKLIF